METESGLFRLNQPAYAEQGIPLIPCSTDPKKPLVNHPDRFGLGGSRKLTAKFSETNALGFVSGRRSRLTVLDVDTTDVRVLRDATDRHGATPLIVRTASGKFHAYYRFNNERRKIKPWRGLPIDLLGDHGLVIAPPSVAAAGKYEIIEGKLEDVQRLPALRGLEPDLYLTSSAPTLPPAPTHDQIREGERNNRLWEHCMREARHCDSLDQLVDAARTRNDAFVPPLPEAEVVKAARSAWRYEQSGQNRFGRHCAVVAVEEADQLIATDLDVLGLLTFLRAHNGPEAEFFIANTLADQWGWRRQRLAAARARLITAGHVEQIRPATSGRPALFRWRMRRPG